MFLSILWDDFLISDSDRKSHMITSHDRRILRELAKQVAEIAHLPIMSERRALWSRHNQLDSPHPMILVFPEGSWREMLPASALRCEGESARAMEWQLRSRLYYHEHIHDDTVIEARWVVNKRVLVSGWGMEARHKPSAEETGAWAFDPVIKTRDDLRKLRFPEVTYDETGSQRDLEAAQELFGDVLDVVQKGVAHISFHLMNVYTGLRGLEQTLLDMCDAPEMLHEAMAFLTEGYQRLVQQYVSLNLLSLNNDETYHSSGGVGYTTELPRPDYDPARIRPRDMWASAESQELDVVSRAMHAEFALRYERRLLAPFGLTGYGCCDRLDTKLDDVMAIPNMRRISIAPFANVDVCAPKLGRRFIFSWKPHPAHLVGPFDADFVRRYLQRTIDVCRDNGCVLEMILKDTHTCENHPERFTQWTDIARSLVD